jgi:hypothetical protein
MATFMFCNKYLVLALAVAILVVAAPHGRANAVPAGAACGDGSMCDKGLWCEAAAGKCAAQAGVCVTIPRLCIARKRSKSFQPVCGCNSKTYSSDCFRRADRIAKSHDGKC